MSSTLARRIATLEQAPPPPPRPPVATWPGGGDAPDGWHPLPPVARTYLLTLAHAAEHGAEEDGELPDLLRLLAEAGGAGVPLVAFQGKALWWAWCRVFHGGGAGDPFRKFWGVERSRLGEAYRERSGAALVALWRASGTRALPPALLRLLAA